jgi:hypothetical protein
MLDERATAASRAELGEALKAKEEETAAGAAGSIIDVQRPIAARRRADTGATDDSAVSVWVE